MVSTELVKSQRGNTGASLPRSPPLPASPSLRSSIRMLMGRPNSANV
jgi:hypothetical protein